MWLWRFMNRFLSRYIKEWGGGCTLRVKSIPGGPVYNRETMCVEGIESVATATLPLLPSLDFYAAKLHLRIV